MKSIDDIKDDEIIKSHISHDEKLYIPFEENSWETDLDDVKRLIKEMDEKENEKR